MNPAAAGWAETAAARVVAWARTLPAGPAGRRVLVIEGRSGSGKTTLAVAVAARLPAPIIHMDQLYAGWDGLAAGVEALRDRVLEPLARGRPAVWRQWDWAAGRYTTEHRVPDGDWLIVEGVGAGATGCPIAGTVWLDSPDDLRRERALARDGDLYAPHWERWARQEEKLPDVRGQAGLIIANGA
ncbi:dephospho-CoA kinase [Actinoplanes sp. SE50]|uniref:dephospho-CoA kinase n=1 Tax=unclassified Actinoplanes TaxID=2626549 RepID=UPI00023EBCEC|nr:MULTISPECIES: dephospho-CoA kinase [unclassified Actinoplanes]AEV82902.1 hypothetical protein ACPL_2005 [Actinoplanes sp. SE50/110]ATO81298.1 dephospho-CoA kinase [Actinoplanes sp. SE50]SLL98705.1 dephospho-CoA kinase [Actinoplanes sp. SE50/110]